MKTKMELIYEAELAKPLTKTRTALQLERITQANQEALEGRLEEFQGLEVKPRDSKALQPVPSGTREPWADFVTFDIPGEFVSVDKTYQTFTNRKGKIQRTKTTEATIWKDHVTSCTRAYQGFLKPSWCYKIRLQVHSNWFTKNGFVKRRDVANAEKLIVDGVSEGLGIDDSCFFEVVLEKVQDSNESKTVVTVEVMFMFKNVDKDAATNFDPTKISSPEPVRDQSNLSPLEL